ncbi:3'-5' exonuclease [Staphylococcus pettenkoferi]|uniref:3'-5' exonuclease n=1 Tax=Staphylococcus pettenkoferi TaxID=170573 RepID=UPI0011A1B024|nr:3'-5' exonuclease [Staphylococcus pettenkoferi]
MKKALLWILLIFSLFTVVGGLLVIIDQGLSFTDLTMLLVFLLIFIMSLFKLIKLNTTKKNKEITNQKEDTPIQLREENKRLNKELNQIKLDLNNANKRLDENNKKPIIVEKEVTKEVESKELIKNNENLKKELASQQDYILKLEKENKQVATLKENTEKTQKSIQELNEKLKVKENQIDELKSENKKVKEDYFSNEKVEPSRSSTHLDLSYTKARKLTPTFVVLDFETTGLNYKDNEIIQYGIVEFKDGNVINEFTKFFKPDQPVGKTVMRKTGITNEFLEDKPRISKEYMEELLLLLGGKTIVAHNAPFDMKFLLKNLHDFNIEHEKFRVFDTLTTSRRLIHETPNHKLETLKDYFILDDGESHQALNDAKATGQLALLLIDRMK